MYGSRNTQAKEASKDFIALHDYEQYTFNMDILMSGLKALDQPTERCDGITRDPNTSECIARYIENQIGCSMNIHGGSQIRKISPCKFKSELNELRKVTSQLQDANANTIYELTGCLASCERNVVLLGM